MKTRSSLTESLVTLPTAADINHVRGIQHLICNFQIQGKMYEEQLRPLSLLGPRAEWAEGRLRGSHSSFQGAEGSVELCSLGTATYIPQNSKHFSSHLLSKKYSLSENTLCLEKQNKA